MSRVLQTVRYLKPIQIYGRVCRPKPRFVRSTPTPRLRVRRGVWIPAIPRPDPQIHPGRFRFLNREYSISGWNDAGISKLWLYNLHYFEAPTTELIQKWIAGNPVGQGNGWEPYPLSLRICNWIKSHLAANILDDAALDSLASQTWYLSQSIEYHLQANHLFANAKALVFAGCFFDTPDWLRQGLSILNRQFTEQILIDGGHFERSPMYHSTILEDALDLVNLGQVYRGLLPDWRDIAARMLEWLRQMIHPDGRIAFFNDAAFGIAPEPSALFDYATRLGIRTEDRPLSESGYIRMENDSAVVIFDAAPIGPDYQPGHAHADTLSFELSISGRRAIVNTGISTYENNSERHAQRSTAAHNTVTIDNHDSSEVWSAFRVARRARPFNVKTDHRTFAEASHDGYRRLKDPVVHTRRLFLEPEELRIVDIIEAGREHEVRFHFHFHPETNTRIELDPKLLRRDESSFWFPEFNKSVANRTVTGQWRGTFPTTFHSRIPLDGQLI